MRRSPAVALVSAAALTFFGLAVTPVAALTPLTLNVNTQADTEDAPCTSSSTTTPNPLSLRDAVCLANNLSTSNAITINVPAGTYSLNAAFGELQLGTTAGVTVTVSGAGAGSTIIDAGGNSRVFNIDMNSVGGVTATLRNLTVQGGNDSSLGGAGILAGSAGALPADSLTLSGVTVTGNNDGAQNPTTKALTNIPGGGLQFLGGSLSITNSTFSNNATQSSAGSAIAYQAFGAGSESFSMTNTTISGNTETNLATAGDIVDGAVQLSSPTNVTTGPTGIPLTISNSTFSGNTGSGTNGPTRGAALTLESGGLSVTGSTFTNNTITGANSKGAAIAVVDGVATIQRNRIVDNAAPTSAQGSGLAAVGAGTVTATNNWWGCNAGPGNAGCDSTYALTAGNLSTAPRLVLGGAAVSLLISATAPVAADLTHDSTGAAVSGTEPELNGIAMGFSNPTPPGSTCSPTSVNMSGGTATGSCTFTPGAMGPGTVTVTVDNQSIDIPVTVNAPPTVSSQPANTTVIAGGNASFNAAATGYPAPTMQWQVSTNGGTTFTDISGATAATLTLTNVPSTSNQNQYRAVFTNGSGSVSSDAATLTVQYPPDFTSGTTANFTVGANGSFTITTSGNPNSTISTSTTLPSGLSLTSNGNGTATLSGKPAAGTGGSYTVNLTAANGITPNAAQALTLVIGESPHVTANPSDATIAPGSSVTFTATASGYPVPTVQWQKSTDGGVTFVDVAGATATTYSTPAITSGPLQYRAVFTNSQGSATTTAATVTVQQAPAITSANSTTFTVGTAGSFTVTATGYPNPSISETGSLPSGVSLVDNGNGTATLSGIPAPGTGGSYTVTIGAANNVAPAATQTFTLTVKDGPTITSANHTTFTAGTAGSFTVQASGVPAPGISETGALPPGVTFVDSGHGTATLSGTPDAGTGGTYPFTITADNGVGTAATQSFTLTVHEAPSITSANNTTFTVGSAGTFTVTTSGFPTTSLSESGNLPSGVTFVDHGDGTAALAGTPTVGSGGSYALTITASNGVGSDATQNFTLKVNEAPAITSADSVSFGAGVTATPFTVTTTGFPTAGLSETGSLPSGVTFVDNGDGTATLAGTPHAGTAGSYPFTITATNGISPNATQSFTLKVTVAPQAITFTSTTPVGAVVGQTYDVAATGGASGNPVTFSIDAVAAGVCSISGSTVTFNHTGNCVVDAHQDGNGQYAPADSSQTMAVGKASTTTTVVVTSSTITATVAVAPPGAGTPTGHVNFSVNGNPVGSAVLSGGVATLTYAVPSGQTQNVAAVYAGDSDFSGSSGSTARQDPTIHARVTSSIARSRFGWYRVPVTVAFTCTTTSAPLRTPCPAPVTLSNNGAGQSVTRTVMATDGGVATVAVNGINIDRTAPKVTITGVTNGANYLGVAPKAKCVAEDALSGVASCRLSRTSRSGTVTVTARATDKAGNVASTRRTYHVLRIFVLNATMRNGAYNLRQGQWFTVVALTSTKITPRYYDAAPLGQRPRPADNYFRLAGKQNGLYRYTIGVFLGTNLGRYQYWVFGVKIGNTMYQVKFHPVL